MPVPPPPRHHHIRIVAHNGRISPRTAPGLGNDRNRMRGRRRLPCPRPSPMEPRRETEPKG
ncbi:hypothetical protein HMPREF0724_13559 [Prescottella equi ATCC 33707]|uniref:Uncharacterized protein n=1 Tax=Prescottella equi ATCC 33707 TaxID=525370 RepID=E9T4T1_RHOHA|nr:hypothetical protein HMPREF0724_13559 [Prescottella equi ATCC 33707]